MTALESGASGDAVRGAGQGPDLLLRALWQGQLASGLYRVEADLWPDALAAQAGAHGWRFFHLYGATIFDKQSFLAACQEALALPGYFGHNWDAFEELINDLSWAPAAGYLLLYERVANFGANSPAEFAVALDILHAAAEAWGQRGAPCYVLLRHTGGCASAAPLLR